MTGTLMGKIPTISSGLIGRLCLQVTCLGFHAVSTTEVWTQISARALNGGDALVGTV